jgi:hypothetical protein
MDSIMGKSTSRREFLKYTTQIAATSVMAAGLFR